MGLFLILYKKKTVKVLCCVDTIYCGASIQLDCDSQIIDTYFTVYKDGCVSQCSQVGTLDQRGRIRWTLKNR